MPANVHPSTPPTVRAPRPAPNEVPRSTWRAYLETRGLVGGHEATHQRLMLPSRDRTPLAASYLPGPGEGGPAVVLLHGFGAHRRKPAYAYLADVLSQAVAVLAIDLRGHGESGGACTMGEREALDALAAVDWVRDRHDWVGLIGVSMGGTAALHAVAKGAQVDAVVAVSTPAFLRVEPQTDAMRRLHRAWSSRTARAVAARGLGVRMVAPEQWSPPPHPAVAARDATVPLLVVHGVDDHFFGIEDAESIARAAPDAVLWREPAGFGHAEDGVGAVFAERLAHAVHHVAHHGRFPLRELDLRD